MALYIPHQGTLYGGDDVGPVSFTNSFCRIAVFNIPLFNLHRCVQRLRKRIADENRQGSNARQGRVPSFYTSRSIVNLSGLSVSDPAPIADGGSYHDQMASVLAQHQQSSSARREHQKAAADFADDLFNKSPEIVNESLVQESLEKNVLDRSRSVNDGADVTDQSSRSIHRIKSEDNLLTSSRKDDVKNRRSSLQRSHSGNLGKSSNSPNVVEKSTNMANFYYRKALSGNTK